MLTVTAEINPFKCWIPEKFFYNLDESKTGWERCEVYALSSYKGEHLCVNVRILSTGGLFHALPVWCLYSSPECEPVIEPKHLSYNVCPQSDITVNQFDYMNSTTIWAFINNSWHECEYIATIDWHTDNLNTHFLSVSTGQYCFIPSHKIVMSNDVPPDKLPAYLKKRYSNTP